MYRLSHRLFALGVSTAVAFIANINIVALPMILVLSYYIGSFPDIDSAWGLKHRGITHNIWFFIAVTFACSIGVFYFYYALQWVIGASFFDVSMTPVLGFPVPTFFHLLGRFDFVAAVNDTLFKFIVFFFMSFMTHFSLDIITPAGLEVGSFTIRGAIPSENKVFNFFFAAVGLITFLVAVAFYVLRSFGVISINWVLWYFSIVGTAVIAVMIASILLKRGKHQDELKCFELDNNIDVCVPRGKCVQIGPDKDDKLCNVDEAEI